MRRPAQPAAGAAAATPVAEPACPTCGRSMTRRVAAKGANAGRAFWGCSGYPGCRGTRQVEPCARSTTESAKLCSQISQPCSCHTLPSHRGRPSAGSGGLSGYCRFAQAVSTGRPFYSGCRLPHQPRGIAPDSCNASENCALEAVWSHRGESSERSRSPGTDGHPEVRRLTRPVDAAQDTPRHGHVGVWRSRRSGSHIPRLAR